MCGAISGFHALVVVGHNAEDDRPGNPGPADRLWGHADGGPGWHRRADRGGVAGPRLYYDINVGQDQAQKWQGDLKKLYAGLEARPAVQEPGQRRCPSQLPVERDLAQVEEMVGESLRGRTGGAVTLAVGMSLYLRRRPALGRQAESVAGLMKYWYHFAIMFEALFILTTIDTGTRIARFLLQEALGRVYRPFERTDWLPGAVLATALVTAGWGVLVYTGSIDTIWPMFGIANQLLAVVALALVTTWLVNTGRGRYALGDACCRCCS